MKMLKRVVLCLMAVMMLFSATVSTAYADQPYRGTTKHKRSLRNASIANADNRYTDLNGQTQDGEIHDGDDAAAGSTQQDPGQVKCAHIKLAQQPESCNHNAVADQGTDGNAADFFTGCTL